MENIERLTPLFIAILTLVGTLIQQHYASEKRIREEKEANERLRIAEQKRHNEELEILKNAIECREKVIQQEIGKLIDGTNSMIRNDILEICRTSIRKQYIDIYTLETLSGLYENYKKFGGNSIVEDLYLTTKALPVIDERDIEI